MPREKGPFADGINDRYDMTLGELAVTNEWPGYGHRSVRENSDSPPRMARQHLALLEKSGGKRRLFNIGRRMARHSAGKRTFTTGSNSVSEDGSHSSGIKATLSVPSAKA